MLQCCKTVYKSIRSILIYNKQSQIERQFSLKAFQNNQPINLPNQPNKTNHKTLSSQMQSMQNKRRIYCDNETDRIPITRTNITIQKKSKENHFDFSRISQIDQLLNKNQEIYKNLRKKLQDISQAQRNITNNINVIRPISYVTLQKSFEAQNQHYEKFFNSNDTYRTNNFQNFASSSIQTQRPLNQSMRRRIQNDSSNILIVSQEPRIKPIIEQQSEMKQSSIHEFIQRQPSQPSNLPSQPSNFKRTNTSKNRIYLQEPMMRKMDSCSDSMSYNYFMNTTTKTTNNNLSHKNLPETSSFYVEKENVYAVNRSYEPLIDSVVRMNFNDLSRRKAEIERIYQQLKKEEEEIQNSYQEYKKNFTSMHEMSTKKQESLMKSVPKKSSPPKKGFDRKSSPSLNHSKISLSSKTNQLPPIIKQTKSSFNPSQKTQQKDMNLDINQTSQIMQKSDYSPVGNRNAQMIKYCTQEFQTGQIPQKPQQMTARSHIFVPFNKLYKSPIIQMKNKNTLILARQSKQLSQKTSQHKIIDGKKFKFPQNIQTDEQELIKNVLKHDINMIAIVGGQQTLKKKLHMAIIAHSVDKILKIIKTSGKNCLSVNLSYREYTQKEGKSKVMIQNSFEIGQEASTKIIALQVQKTVEEIYQAIKRSSAPLQPTSMNKSASQQNKDKGKMVKMTKIQLLSGKEFIWISHILSTNQLSFDFLKNLEVKDIIWSINPLIKNYDDVSKTLNEANRYIETKMDV